MGITELEILSDVTEMGIVIFHVIALYALWNTFLGSVKEKYTVLAGSALLIINVIAEICGSLPKHGHFLLSTGLILGYSFARYRWHSEKAVLTLTMFFGFRSFSFLAANCIYQYSQDMMLKKLEITAEDYVEKVMEGTSYTLILFFVLYVVFFAVMLVILRKIFVSVQKMSWYDVCFLSVLNVSGGLFAEVIANIGFVKLESAVFNLFDEKREIYWMFPLIAVLLFLGELSAITIYQNYRTLQKEREQYIAEQQQIAAMKRRLEEAENFYGSIRRARHEMRNHMTNIKGLVAGEQYAEAECYIAKLDGAIGELDYKYATGNAVTDVIINDKSRLADKAEIRFEVQFFCEDTGGIDVFDLGIVLNNLLDNAVTACEKVEKGERYIRLALKRKKKFLLLEVENSFDGEVKSAGDGLPQTTKESSLPEILMEHGVGLRNVKEIAERYLGTMDIKVKSDVFKVTVMLQRQEERR